jgi:hypothetical protein
MCSPLIVIASEAKQSIDPQRKAWIASSLTLLAMTEEVAIPPSQDLPAAPSGGRKAAKK